MISAKEAARILGVTDARVRVLCRQKRIPGAKIIGSVWVLPDHPVVIAGTRKRPGKINPR